MKVVIPRRGDLQIISLVLDFNGTIALDGRVLESAARRLDELCKRFAVYVVTADTFGSVKEALKGYDLNVRILHSDDHTEEKRKIVEALGAQTCAAIGNGANDARMLKTAGLGMAVVGAEGASLEAILSADLLCPDIDSALDLLLYPNRLKATLRR